MPQLTKALWAVTHTYGDFVIVKDGVKRFVLYCEHKQIGVYLSLAEAKSAANNIHEEKLSDTQGEPATSDV